MIKFRYEVDYDEKNGEWDVVLVKDNWHHPYWVASFRDKQTAESVCALIESLREELMG